MPGQDNERVIRVGRNTTDYTENEIHFDDPAVSRRHMEMRLKPDGKVEIRDLGSLNGTWLDNTRIESLVWTTVLPHQSVYRNNDASVVNVYEAFGLPSRQRENAQDYRQEWADIKTEFHRIEDEKNQLEMRHHQKNMWMGGGLTIASGVCVVLLTPSLPQDYRIYTPLISSLLIAARFVIQLKQHELKKKLKNLDNELQMLYRCPGKKSNGNRCDRMFGTSIQPNVLEANPQCSSCGAKYI